MTVLLRSDWRDIEIRDAFNDCFCDLCDEPIDRTEPNVGWWGRGNGRLWHRNCAERIGIALIQDAREAELSAGKQPHWTRRAAKAAGAALRVAEGVK